MEYSFHSFSQQFFKNKNGDQVILQYSWSFIINGSLSARIHRSLIKTNYIRSCIFSSLFFSFFSFNFLIKPQTRYETNKICILFIYSEDRYSRYFCMCAPGMNIDKKRKQEKSRRVKIVKSASYFIEWYKCLFEKSFSEDVQEMALTINSHFHISSTISFLHVFYIFLIAIFSKWC